MENNVIHNNMQLTWWTADLTYIVVEINESCEILRYSNLELWDKVENSCFNSERNQVGLKHYNIFLKPNSMSTGVIVVGEEGRAAVVWLVHSSSIYNHTIMSKEDELTLKSPKKWEVLMHQSCNNSTAPFPLMILHTTKHQISNKVTTFVLQ